MAERHDGKVAVITGAAGGLGRETALRLAAGGARVACADVEPVGLAETVGQVTAAGGLAVGYRVDVTDESSVQQWREDVRTDLGGPSMVLNVAGILDRRQLADVDLDSFLHVLKVNLGGCYATARAFTPDLVGGGWGRIVNIASIAALVGYPYPSYGASKAGLVSLTRSLLIDLWGTGVTVNALCPGAMDTPMMNRLAVEQMRAKTPAGRIATPEEVAGVADFLCSDAASCINGTTLVVDGGATAVFRYFEE